MDYGKIKQAIIDQIESMDYTFEDKSTIEGSLDESIVIDGIEYFYQGEYSGSASWDEGDYYTAPDIVGMYITYEVDLLYYIDENEEEVFLQGFCGEKEW